MFVFFQAAEAGDGGDLLTSGWHVRRTACPRAGDVGCIVGESCGKPSWQTEACTFVARFWHLRSSLELEEVVGRGLFFKFLQQTRVGMLSSQIPKSARAHLAERQHDVAFSLFLHMLALVQVPYR